MINWSKIIVDYLGKFEIVYICNLYSRYMTNGA